MQGLGSYLALAIERGDQQAITAGVLAMTLLVVLVDFAIWRPVLAWARKFRMTESPDEEDRLPFVSYLFRDSLILKWASQLREAFRKQLQHESELDVEAPRLEIVRARRKRKKRPSRLREVLKNSTKPLFWASFTALVLFGLSMVYEIVRPLHKEEWLMILSAGGSSLLRVLTATFLATLWTVPAAVYFASSVARLKFAQPIVQILASFPVPILFPAFLPFFLRSGLSYDVTATLLMCLGVQWYLLFNVLAGASSIPRELRELLQSMNVSRVTLWKRLILPCIFPSLVTGWITTVGGAWNATIVTEVLNVGTQSYRALGLGSLITESAATKNVPVLGASLLLLVFIVVFWNRSVWLWLLKISENRFRWEK
jgi:NitT/TauT family transport system permease protein